MCGRFAYFVPYEQLTDHYGLAADAPPMERYNVAPSQDILAIRQAESGERPGEKSRTHVDRADPECLRDTSGDAGEHAIGCRAPNRPLEGSRSRRFGVGPARGVGRAHGDNIVHTARIVQGYPALPPGLGPGAPLGYSRGMKKVDIEEFFRRLEERDPDPRGELNYINPYTLLVAVVLSAQATDVGVNKATGPLFKVADTPEKMVALGVAKLRDYIKTIGLYNNKAKNVIGLSEKLIAEHGSEVLVQDFDRYLAFVLEILGEEDGRHTAAPELPLVGVGVGNGRFQAFHLVAHGVQT